MAHEIRVLEECRIHPLSSAPFSDPLTTPLAYFDLPWLACATYKPVYFYEFHHSKIRFVETLLPKIKHSLSLALQHYYPLAGHLTWPQDRNKPEIVYKPGDSVPLLVVESDLDFCYLSGNQPKDVNVFCTVIPKFARKVCPDDKLVPVLALQITLFPDKGMSIGFNFNHSVVDGRAASNFISAWASICRLEGKAEMAGELRPFLDRSIVQDPKGIELKLLEKDIFQREKFNVSNMSMHTTPLVDMVLATFVVGCSEITRLRKLVSSRLEAENEPPLYLSAFVLTVSYVWICLIKALWGENRVSEEMEYLICLVDCRARLEPSLPASYFGNCLGTINIMAKRSELQGRDGIAFAAKLLAKEVQNVNKCVWNAFGEGVYRSLAAPVDQLMGPAGSPKFGLYDTDFGWGKPKKVEVRPIESTTGVSLADCPKEKGAIEVGLVCNKIKMEAFSSMFEENLKYLQ